MSINLQVYQKQEINLLLAGLGSSFKNGSTLEHGENLYESPQKGGS
jgi:hypothetical protein